MKINSYLKVNNPTERCLFINVSDISLLLNAKSMKNSLKLKKDSLESFREILFSNFYLLTISNYFISNSVLFHVQ